MRSWCLAALLGLCAVPVWSATPDAGTPDSNSTFQSFTRLGGRVVFLGFFANDAQCGLWATDGTAAGTGRLADLCAGSLSPGDAAQVQILGVTGPLAFLSDSLGQLWRTDGTAAGTFSLAATVSTSGGIPVGRGGIFYFAACDAARVCEPWRSDGSVAGTRLLRAVQAGAQGHSAFLQFAVDDNRVMFSGVGSNGPTLWATDGTTPGTREIAHFPEFVWDLVALDGAVYASTRDSTTELWFVPPGGHASRRLGSFPIDYRSPGLSLFKAGGRILFKDDLGGGLVDLWEITAFHDRPRLVARFDRGLGPIAEAGRGVVLAAGVDPIESRLFLWFLAPGTRHPTPLSGCPEGCPSVESPFSPLGVRSGRVIFAGRDQRGGELWETDGTGPGTRLVKDLCPGECDGSPSGFTPALRRLIFTAGDRELWVTDGTAGGTARLGRILSSLANGLDAAELNGRLIFNGLDDAHGSQPWVSDLTPAGTAPLVILEPQP